MKKKCKKDEILNSKTNRCVKRSGKIGKEILSKKTKVNSISKNNITKKCKKDEILNPKTNRCVKRSGKIGKELLIKKSKKPKEIVYKPQIYYAGYKVLYKGHPATITARYYGNNNVKDTYEIIIDKTGKIYDFIHYNDLELIN